MRKCERCIAIDMGLNQAKYAASPEQDSCTTTLLTKEVRKYDEHREQEIKGTSNGLFSYTL